MRHHLILVLVCFFSVSNAFGIMAPKSKGLPTYFSGQKEGLKELDRDLSVTLVDMSVDNLSLSSLVKREISKIYTEFDGGTLENGEEYPLQTSGGFSPMSYVIFDQVVQGYKVDGAQIVATVKLVGGLPTLLQVTGRLMPKIEKLNLSESSFRKMGIAGTYKIGLKRRKWQLYSEVFDREKNEVIQVGQDGVKEVYDPRVYFAPSGKIGGRGVFFDPFKTGTNLDLLPMGNLEVGFNGQKVVTNPDGSFSFSDSMGSVGNFFINLSGPWVQVVDKKGGNLKYDGAYDPNAPKFYNFNNTGETEATTAQVNGFYHTNAVFDWVRSRGVTIKGMEIRIPANVNLNDTCNAYYDYQSINFFSAGDGCPNTAYDTVVYHEYGHFVDDKAGGISSEDGLSEGWGDTLAVFITGQSFIAESFFGEGNAIRNAENTYKYDSKDEVHRSGQAWAGFAWQLRKRMIAKYGSDKGTTVAEQLVIPTILANASNIPKAVKQVLMRDDDDGNLKNGSPNSVEIYEAAKFHGITVK